MNNTDCRRPKVFCCGSVLENNLGVASKETFLYSQLAVGDWHIFPDSPHKLRWKLKTKDKTGV